MRRLGQALLAPVALLAVWQAVVWISAAPRYILPSPPRVFAALYDNAALIAGHAVVTVEEVLLGLALGTLFGAATAIAFAMSDKTARLFMPFAVVSQAVPVFALAPILTLWLGYGLWSKVLMAVLIVYFPVCSTLLDALARTDPGLLDLAGVAGAGGWRTLVVIRIPAALPALGSGLRLAAVYAPIGAVIGEWVGASNGLGYLMLLANGRTQTDLMFAALLVLAAFTVALYGAAALLARYLAMWTDGALSGS